MARAAHDRDDTFRGHYPADPVDRQWRDRVAACRHHAQQSFGGESLGSEGAALVASARGALGWFCQDKKVEVRGEARRGVLVLKEGGADLVELDLQRAARSAAGDLHHWRARVRRRACRDLGDLGAAAAAYVEALGRCYANDEDEQVCLAARTALAKLKEAGVAIPGEYLENAAAHAARDLQDQVWFVRRDACRDLGAIGPAALPHWAALSQHAVSPQPELSPNPHAFGVGPPAASIHRTARQALAKLDTAAVESDTGMWRPVDDAYAYSAKRVFTPSTVASSRPMST